MSIGQFVIDFAPHLAIAVTAIVAPLAVFAYRARLFRNVRNVENPERESSPSLEHFDEALSALTSSTVAAQRETWACVDKFYEAKKLLEASMHTVESFLTRDFFTGSQLAAAQQDAKLEECEWNFAKARQSLLDAAEKVRTRISLYQIKAFQLELYLHREDWKDAREKARQLIAQAAQDYDAVNGAMDAVARIADYEPVCKPEQSRFTFITEWRQERAEVRKNLRLRASWAAR